MRAGRTGGHLAGPMRGGYAVRKRRSEESMQLDKVQPPVLGIVLRNTIVPTKARAYLRELNRRVLVHQTPARLLPVLHGAFWIEEFVRDLQVVAASDEPIGLEQGGEFLALPVGDALIIGYLCLGQPRDGAGPEPTIDRKRALGSDGLGVVVRPNTHAPNGFHVGHISTGLLSVTRDVASGSAVADRQLRIPVAFFPSEFHALIRRGHVDSGRGIDQGGLILEAQTE